MTVIQTSAFTEFLGKLATVLGEHLEQTTPAEVIIVDGYSKGGVDVTSNALKISSD